MARLAACALAVAFFTLVPALVQLHHFGRRKAPAAMLSTEAKGKLHFLFMLRDRFLHEDVWKAFFAGASPKTYTIFAHCSDESKCKSAPVFEELGIELVPTVPSAWCRDLVSPAAQLMRAALRADGRWRPFPRGGRSKFILVSESTLPLRPLSAMSEILLRRDHSDICIVPKQQWDRASDILGVGYRIVKHHQWAVLDRNDAEAFEQGWARFGRRRKDVGKSGELKVHGSMPGMAWMVPRMGRDGRANFSDVVPRRANKRCPDEEVLTSFIFGMYEPSQDRLWNKILSRSACRTYVRWVACAGGTAILPFDRVDDELRQLASNSSDSAYFFARKFSARVPSAEVIALLAPKGQQAA